MASISKCVYIYIDRNTINLEGILPSKLIGILTYVQISDIAGKNKLQTKWALPFDVRLHTYPKRPTLFYPLGAVGLAK